MARRLQAPREFDRRRLIRCVKYLKGTPRWGHELKIDGHPGKIALDLWSDTNYAPDDDPQRSRRAMTCGVTTVDGAPYACFARRQAVQSTSSGESEFYGAGSTAMEGKVVWGLFEWLGYAVTCSLRVDSSAAKAMLMRDGVGKVKHLDVRSLWVQQERHNGMKIKKEPGATNLADFCTKAHPQNRFEELRKMVGMMDCSRVDEFTPKSACVVSAQPRRSGSTMKKAAAQATALLLAAMQAAHVDGFCTEFHDKPDLATDLTKMFSMVLNTVLIAGIVYLMIVSKKPMREAMTQTDVDTKPSRTVACQSQCGYKWWWAKPEFRVLAAQSAGCSFDNI